MHPSLHLKRGAGSSQSLHFAVYFSPPRDSQRSVSSKYSCRRGIKAPTGSSCVSRLVYSMKFRAKSTYLITFRHRLADNVLIDIVSREEPVLVDKVDESLTPCPIPSARLDQCHQFSPITLKPAPFDAQTSITYQRPCSLGLERPGR